MQPEPNAKQLVVERIKSTTNILVTVSRDPSVDELSAALGLTLMLNKMDKHATAVFSGAVPPAIEFLEPGKTFEHTTDSLRDFIIALDKEKADRLRYKVEEDVVRIFITPYRTKITEQDLNYSQGDFNVELIIALGVEKREDIDAAVTAHGRILHDATVVTINNKSEKSSVGSIDWSDGGASSLCEMLMSLSEALQSGILDQQMSTALLTGIVAATDRFRNERTSPKVMTMAAQLMAAGANQQLIATKLEEKHELELDEEVKMQDGSTHPKEGESEKVLKDVQKEEEEPPKHKEDGEMTIVHDKEESPEPEVAPEPEPEPQPEPELEAAAEPKITLEPTPNEETPADEAEDAESELEAQLDAVMTPPPPVNELKNDLTSVGDAVSEQPETPIVGMPGSWRDRPTAAPAFGGTLNATVDKVDENAPRQDVPDERMTLSHTPVTTGMPPQFDQPAPDTVEQPEALTPPEPPTEPLASVSDPQLSYEPTPEAHEQLQETPPAGGIDDARAAVDAALNAVPFNPAGQPLQSAGAQPLGEDIRPVDAPPQLGTAPVMDSTPTVEPMPPTPVEQPVPTMTTEPAPAPVMPPLPDFSTLPPLPGEAPAVAPTLDPAPHPAMTDPTLSQDATVTVPTDPGQFQIPGSK